MRLLVVSPHPDDETLGGGGTIAKAKQGGHEVYWLNVTGMPEDEYTGEQIHKREEQIKKVIDFYQFDGTRDLKLPTTKLDTIPDHAAIGMVSGYIKEIEPHVLIIPDYNDAHSDHRVIFRWLHACTKSFRYPFIKGVLTMEILSETNFGLPNNPFIPNIFIDISEFMDKKIQALSIYESEIGDHPFPRSMENVKALAHLRGSEAYVKYAEGFRVIKAIL